MVSATFYSVKYQKNVPGKVTNLISYRFLTKTGKYIHRHSLRGVDSKGNKLSKFISAAAAMEYIDMDIPGKSRNARNARNTKR